MIAGQTAPEYDPSGNSTHEITKLYKWVCQLVDMPIKKG